MVHVFCAVVLRVVASVAAKMMNSKEWSGRAFSARGCAGKRSHGGSV